MVMLIACLCSVYKVTEHKKYKNGEWDENKVFEEFLKSYEPDPAKRDGKVRITTRLSCCYHQKYNNIIINPYH